MIFVVIRDILLFYLYPIFDYDKKGEKCNVIPLVFEWRGEAIFVNRDITFRGSSHIIHIHHTLSLLLHLSSTFASLLILLLNASCIKGESSLWMLNEIALLVLNCFYIVSKCLNVLWFCHHQKGGDCWLLATSLWFNFDDWQNYILISNFPFSVFSEK